MRAAAGASVVSLERLLQAVTPRLPRDDEFLTDDVLAKLDTIFGSPSRQDLIVSLAPPPKSALPAEEVRAAFAPAQADIILALIAPRTSAEAEADTAMSLPEAAALMGEPVSTFRRRLDYRKALLTRPGERRLRYSRVALDRIKRDRLATNGEDWGGKAPISSALKKGKS
jgi:hypothetical protein